MMAKAQGLNLAFKSDVSIDSDVCTASMTDFTASSFMDCTVGRDAALSAAQGTAAPVQ